MIPYEAAESGGLSCGTNEARIQHAPRIERYPSDVSDAEWALVASMIPPPRPGGRPRDTDMREVFNAMRYVLRTGCQWRQLPKDFPPRSTVYNYFWEWTRYGVLDRIHHALLVQCRGAEGREASPTAGIIDTQTVKATEKGGPIPIRSDTMRARKSRASSATRLSTRQDCCSASR
jgi:transposase